MSKQKKENRKWRKLDSLSAVLEFSHKERTGDSTTFHERPPELSDRRGANYSLEGQKQEFTDGTALVVLSGICYTGYCETCASEEPVGLFYALEKDTE